MNSSGRNIDIILVIYNILEQSIIEKDSEE